MLTKDHAADIFNRITKLATADEVEVLFSGGRSALTRFANNTIHHYVAEENHRVLVRTMFGGRNPRASNNKFDHESLLRDEEEDAKADRSYHAQCAYIPPTNL